MPLPPEAPHPVAHTFPDAATLYPALAQVVPPLGALGAAAQGITTKPSSLLLIAPQLFTQWLETASFRNEVLGLFAERMADLTGLIDAVAFHKLDQRLAGALLGRGQDLALTHQQLADELGTVREIISRLLRRFEREGWVELAREHIHIRNSVALRSVATGLSVQ